MLRPTAKKVSVLDDYRLLLVFDTGESRVFDVKPYIRGNFYGELADRDYFKGVKVNGYSVEWQNGQDICPDELYGQSVACLDGSRL